MWTVFTMSRYFERITITNRIPLQDNLHAIARSLVVSFSGFHASHIRVNCGNPKKVSTPWSQKLSSGFTARERFLILSQNQNARLELEMERARSPCSRPAPPGTDSSTMGRVAQCLLDIRVSVAEIATFVRRAAQCGSLRKVQ